MKQIVFLDVEVSNEKVVDFGAIYEDNKSFHDVSERNFSTAQWSSLYNGEEYTYTYNSGESAREMLNLFLQNEKFTVRHNGTVSEFVCNPEDLIKLMSSRGVSIDELDAAMTNEEF